MPRWKKKSSKEVGRSSIFTMVEDHVIMKDGTERKYTIVEFPDFAGILPIHEDKFVFIKNYRYPIDEFVLELPAGLIDEGETPSEAAERELEEETGFLVDDMEELCEYHPMASLNTQRAHLFVGHVKPGGAKSRDDGEDMVTCLIEIQKVYNMLLRREIEHPHTMIALFYAKNLPYVAKHL